MSNGLSQLDLIKAVPADQLDRLQAIMRHYLAEVDTDIMEAYSISPELLDIFNSIYFDKLRVEILDRDFFRLVLLWNKEVNIKFTVVLDDTIEGCGMLMPPNEFNENTILDLLESTVTMAEKLFTDFVTICESFDYTIVYDSDDPELSLEDPCESIDPARVFTDFLSTRTAEKFNTLGTVANYINFMNGNSISCYGRVIPYANSDPDLNYVCTYVKDGNVLIARVMTTTEMGNDIVSLICYKEDNYTPLSYREAKRMLIEVVRELDTYTMNHPIGGNIS